MTEISISEKYTLLAEWFDYQSAILRAFYLNYYPYDDSIELFDRKANRMFLKRMKVGYVTMNDLFPGNTVEILSRHIKLTDYANEFTRRKMGKKMQKILAIIKPEAIEYKGKILKMICENDLKVSKLKMLKLTKELAEEIFEENQNDETYPSLIASILSGPVIALEIVADNAGEKLKEMAGPEDPDEARGKGCFGKDSVLNAIHIEVDERKAEKAASIIFGPKTTLSMNVDTSTVCLENTTCCVIKPHAIRDGHLGEIVAMIEENDYEVTAMEMYYLDGVNAEEFLEVYKEVVLEYSGMVSELMSGGCVAMEIKGPMGPETSIEFRKLVGPNDPTSTEF